MCQNGATCLPAEYCFSELALQKSNNRVGQVQSKHHHHLIEGTLFSP